MDREEYWDSVARARERQEIERRDRQAAEADAQALADVRTLDAWADKRAGTVQLDCEEVPKAFGEMTGGASGQRLGWQLWLISKTGKCLGQYRGHTPDAARAKAAAWVREQAKGAEGAPPCTCGAYNEPDYSDGDHSLDCPRAKPQGAPPGT